ncbi:MAG TPA: hypothetical protein VMW18_08860 [Candidatus Binatia bacterium]|nr:hypothetical protein [Candidatus Binatia bacterium]
MTVGQATVTAPAPAQGAAPKTAWWVVGLFTLLAAGEHYFYARSNGAVLTEGGLVDTDSYMRVLKIMDLYNGAGWYDTVTPRLGAPEGLSLHWTRPVDLLILLPALLAHALGADMARAVYWIGAGFSTACHILACIAVAWAARPLWPTGHRFAAVILLTNAAAFGYGTFGRADHHTLLLLLTVLMLGAMLRSAMGDATPRVRRRWAAAGGLYAGLGVWVSPEFLVPLVPVIATLGLFWVDAPLDAKEARAHGAAAAEIRDWAMPGALFALVMAMVILVAIPIEQPPQRWLAAEYDKVSLPYLVLPLIWAAVFLVAGRVRGGFWVRVIVGLALSAAGAGLLLALFPNLLFGPLGVDDRLKRDFLDSVQEMQPLWPTSVTRLRGFLPMAGQSIAAIVLLPFALKRWRSDRHWAGLLIAMAFCFMLIGAQMHARLGVEFSPTIAIICAGFFALAEARLRRAPHWQRTPGLTLVAIALTVGPMLASLALPKLPAGVTCPVHDLANWLNQAHPGESVPAAAPGTAPIVMTDDYSYAPELAFRTDYRFVAGPYHRNPQAIFDTIDTMTATDDSQAKTILDKRQVALVVRCSDVIVPRLFEANTINFYAKLDGRGALPGWLTPLDLPAGLAKHFKVYAVQGR